MRLAAHFLVVFGLSRATKASAKQRRLLVSNEVQSRENKKDVYSLSRAAKTANQREWLISNEVQRQKKGF